MGGYGYSQYSAAALAHKHEADSLAVGENVERANPRFLCGLFLFQFGLPARDFFERKYA